MLGPDAFTFQRAQSKTKIDDILCHKDVRMEFCPPITLFPYNNGHAIISTKLNWNAEVHQYLQVEGYHIDKRCANHVEVWEELQDEWCTAYEKFDVDMCWSIHYVSFLERSH